MTTLPVEDHLVLYADPAFARPMPEAVFAARRDVLAAAQLLSTIPDAALARAWTWKGGSEEELRYGFYRLAEAFEAAGVAAGEAMRAAGDRGRSADLIAPSTAARWDLHGLLVSLPDELWDADPGGGEWTIRQTLGHLIASQRGYGIGTAYWQREGYGAGDPALPATAPKHLWTELPDDDAEGAGAPTEVRERLDFVVDRPTEILAAMPADRLLFGSRWSGFAVDVAFRFGRWSSHLREHTVQVEKTLAMLDHRPTEVDRLRRVVLAAWGRAEAQAYASTWPPEALAPLVRTAEGAVETAQELAALAAG